MVTYNILGDCVSRDICTPLVEKERAKILQYSSFSNPISMLSNKPELELAFDDLTIEGNGFFKRCTLFDFNKKSLDYIFESESDYLILDLLDARIYMMRKDGHFITLNSYTKKLLPFLDEKFHIKDYVEVSPFVDIDKDTWVKTIENFCEKILKRYSRSQIILLKHFGVEDYVNKTGGISKFVGMLQDCRDCNSLVSELFDICQSKLKGCHVINFPKNVIADINHKWGIHYLHYHRYYYDFGAKALEIISRKLDIGQEVEELLELELEYSDKFELLCRMLRLNNTLRDTERARAFGEKLANDLLTNSKFKNWLEQCKINNKKLAVLKCNDMAGRILVKALEANNIEICFKSHYATFKTFNNEQMDLCRQADCIVSANIHDSVAPVVTWGGELLMLADIIK